MPTRITPDDFDAVLFDLDGVLTTTRTVHAAAVWKRTFDRDAPARRQHSTVRRAIRLRHRHGRQTTGGGSAGLPGLAEPTAHRRGEVQR